MAVQLPDDGGFFQWVIAGVTTAGVVTASAGASALVFIARSLGGRIEAVEVRGNIRIDAADKRIDIFREEVRQEAKAEDDRLWQAINTNRQATEARQHEIMQSMATKGDIADLRRFLESVITARRQN